MSYLIVYQVINKGQCVLFKLSNINTENKITTLLNDLRLSFHMSSHFHETIFSDM